MKYIITFCIAGLIVGFMESPDFAAFVMGVGAVMALLLIIATVIDKLEAEKWR